jgi:site-specific DNA-methyltransferase (adenine-specific)
MSLMKSITNFENRIILGDCVSVLKDIPNGTVDLIFTDPPYNIGIKYDLYKDTMEYCDYVDWSWHWISECVRVLKKNGSLYIAINDENAAEFVGMLKGLNMNMRNWIIWHYTFGQAQKRKFSRAHTHLLYFTKDPSDFTFNSEAIRVKSVRQEIGDKRANPKGKIPDDVWTISRVAGTFNERVKDFPCQMPIKLLERVIKTSSNPGDIVLDPFSGTGTTPYVTKLLKRKYIAIEVSPQYHKISEARINSIPNDSDQK